MPFCPNCGKEVAAGSVYCASCGRSLQAVPSPPPYVQQQYYSRKDEGIAAILSLIIPGVGQIYTGRVLRGIVIFFAPTLFFIFVGIPVFFGSLFTAIPQTVPTDGISTAMNIMFPFFVIIPLLILVGLGFWVWNIFDAYNLARTYNQQLGATGRPPW